MSKFHADNMALVTLELKKFAENEAKREVIRRLRRIAERMADLIDSRFADDSEQFPQFTGNLHDATGIAIYDEGRLESYLPTQRATGPQESPSGEDEWGSEELTNVIRQGATRFSKGLWLVMFSASSYAERIEDMGSPADRGRSFFTSLWEYLSIDIKSEFGGSTTPMFGLSNVMPF